VKLNCKSYAFGLGVILILSISGYFELVSCMKDDLHNYESLLFFIAIVCVFGCGLWSDRPLLMKESKEVLMPTLHCRSHEHGENGEMRI
jgi:hypothetical protein